MSELLEEQQIDENEENTEEIVEENEVQTKKKVRKFHAKEFRQQLGGNSSINAIKEFVRLCNHENSSQDLALEYLESGGGCIELIRVIENSENRSASHILPVLEALTIMLLKIISSFPQKQLNGEESSRELLNKHFSIVKSMLGLNSNSIQRKVALKLLATMVTLSPKLARDILSQVFFDESSLQVFTTPSNVEDGSSVRTAFIYFLISFLIEGHSDIIQLLLQKNFLIQSIFPGLIYDTPDIINVFLSTVQSNVLENSDLSKTVKMNIFSQKIIQNLINLYEWKGPKSYNPSRKKRPSIVVNIDDKNLVCDMVHNFLTILCTSRKFGIIFQDETLGLTHTKHNSLLSNVIKSLNKPWNNKLVSDLVVKICISCPDLIKDILHDIETSLETRASQNWLNAVRFITEIIKQLEPKYVEKFFAKLSSKQLFNAIQIFCVPQSVLNIISNESVLYENIGIRHESILLLLTMLDSLEKYLFVIHNSQDISAENKSAVKQTLTNYLNNNLPPASEILKNWRKSDDIMDDDAFIPIPEYNIHLSLLLDVLYKYKLICPALVAEITKELEINEFLETIEQISTDETITVEMQTKAINLFISFDASLFHPTKELFSYSFPLLLKIYFNSDLNNKVEPILCNILKATAIFEGCDDEILIFLYSIKELENCDEKFSQFLTLVFRDISKNFLKYNSELGSLKDGSENFITFSIKDWLKSTKNNAIKMTEKRLKHKNLSPLVIGLLNQLLQTENSEIQLNVNKILVHLLFAQTDPNILTSLLMQEKYKVICSKYLLKYCKNNKDISSLNYLIKLLNSENTFGMLFNFMFTDESDFKTILNSPNISFNSHYSILTTNFIIYFYTQSSVQQKLTTQIQNKCLKIILHIINNCEDNKILQNCLECVFRHPVLLEMFSPTNDSQQTSDDQQKTIKTIEDLCTSFVIEIIEELLKTRTRDALENYIQPFRLKLVRKICDMLKNYKGGNKIVNTDKLMSIIKLFNFSFDQSEEIIKIISSLPHTAYIVKENICSIVPEIFRFILNKNFDNLKPFDNEIIRQIGNNIQKLNKSEVVINLEDLENSLSNYITKYPHVNISFNAEFFTSLILKNIVNKSTINLATTLIKHNKELVKSFELNFDQILEKRDLVFSVLNVIKDYDTSNEILAKIYKEYEQIILKFINKPQKISNYLIENYPVIVKFVQDYMSTENCNNIAEKVQKFDVTEQYHSEVLIAVFIKAIISEENEEKKSKIVMNFILTMIHLLNNGLKRNEKSDNDWSKIEKITSNFSMLIIKIKNVYKINITDESIYKNAAFQNFAKLALKFGLGNKPILIKLLKQLCQLTSEKNPELSVIFDMAISHSESLNILLSENDMKAPLLSLFLILCQKCPEVMAKSHIPVWLGAYSASLSECDQYILQLLSLYEKAELGFHEYRPYLWGSAAVSYYSVRSGGVNNLWRQPKPKDVIDLLNEDKINRTVVNFPRSRQLSPSDTLYSDSDLDVYDPAFYLPLLSHILAPESTVRWYNLSNRGVISLAIISLSSESEDIRAAACHVLARFHGHVEAAEYAKQRLLWQHLIECICRGTSSLSNLCLSSPVAIFLCRCVTTFTKPDDVLYKPLGQYIMAKECPNFNAIPELLEMLFNANVTYKFHRIFILKVIRDGLKTKTDVEIVFHSMAFKLIMEMYNSTVSNFESKNITLEILANAVSVPLGSRNLINNYSLLSWLHTVLHQISVHEFDLLVPFIDILNNLVTFMTSSILKHFNYKILLILVSAIEILKKSHIDLNGTLKFVKTLYLTYEQRPDGMNKTQLCDLINFCAKFVDSKVCNYYLNFGIEFIQQPSLKSEDSESLLQYYLQLLTVKWIEANKI